jgi:hypothetical protein
MHTTQHRHRQAFHHPRTSLCSAGYWFNVAGLIAPLVIGELIKDPDAKWRAIRISALFNGALSGAFWSAQVQRRRAMEREYPNSPEITR